MGTDTHSLDKSIYRSNAKRRPLPTVWIVGLLGWIPKITGYDKGVTQVLINSNSTFLELVDDYHQRPEKFVFFVGAGLSQPLFPSWKTLLIKFVKCAKEGDLVYDEDELLKYIENGENYLDIADACVSAMGSARYRDIMEKVFDKDFSESDIPEGYRCLMDLSPKTVITTNYDRIPEIAGKGRYRIITNKNAPEAARFLSSEKNIVFKIHGDITDQSSIVFTTNEGFGA